MQCARHGAADHVHVRRLASATRFDVLHSAQLALVEWNLRRNVALTASLQRQHASDASVLAPKSH
jgi:hypothetical protein